MRRPGKKYVPSIGLGESARASARIVLLDLPAGAPARGRQTAGAGSACARTVLSHGLINQGGYVRLLRRDCSSHVLGRRARH